MNSPAELFPENIADAVDGLAYLGHLEQEVRFCGHRFLLRTLKAGEELEAALLAKDWQDTMGQMKAHAWAHLAASMVAVDGDENFCPAIGPGTASHMRGKFQFMIDHWYWSVGEYLFGQFIDLTQRQVDAIEAIEGLSVRSPQNSLGSVGSLTSPGDSGPATPTPSNSDFSPISPEQMKTLADESE